MPPDRPRRQRAARRGAVVAVLAAASLAGLLTGPAHAGGDGGDGPHGPADRELRRRLQALVGTPGGPPGAVAVLTAGGRSEVYRAGTSQIGTGRPPRTGDHMRIASTAKAFSGSVALHLADRGALSLDDTLGRRLPRLPSAWHRVTLRQLLNHTSGLPDYTEAPTFIAELTADPRRHFDSRKLLDYVAGDPLRFRPGSAYRYSNSDNIAVALMAEAATGQRYERLLAELVYRPLGLRHTTLPQGYRLPEPYLHGYATDAPDTPEDVSTVLSASGVWASGGIVSTPRDLGAFIRGYAGGRGLGPAVRRQQLTFVEGSSEPAGPGRNRAGLALFSYTTRCGTVYGHTGNFPGYTQLAAGTKDGKRSLTVSLTSQVNSTTNPRLLATLRALQEDFVCRLLDRREPGGKR
ncbi:serine hydrolase domain-containing protein [Streptomyces sp. C11-1]|uniref:Serine hydrolase domain-containing protein n=1 Tax=Streptomyces durocortorensis TaxID=2811104 RepID=A0ABY9W8F2_9ACTN|nr:serine hydrolase domain-containing protein [Streptomyces durocortorensis]WNF31135.1 serine hydrolase domain-containing protein [Streptomyces durocortorensis]